MANFKTHRDKNIDTCGTSLQGEIIVSYSTLVKKFGQPFEGYDKTDAEWNIEDEHGTVATIYNYKDGKNYNGRSGKATSRITEWHIGGRDNKSFELVNSILGEKPPKKVTKKTLEAWLGSDQMNTDNLVKLLVEVANGKYTPDQLKKDILSYE